VKKIKNECEQLNIDPLFIQPQCLNIPAEKAGIDDSKALTLPSIKKPALGFFLGNY